MTSLTTTFALCALATLALSLGPVLIRRSAQRRRLRREAARARDTSRMDLMIDDWATQPGGSTGKR